MSVVLAEIAAHMEQQRRLKEYRRKNAHYYLLELLLREGEPHGITKDDLARFIEEDERGIFLRSILIELLVCLRTPVSPEARAQAKRLASQAQETADS